MTVNNKTEIHKYREQTSGYQWGRGKRRGKTRIWD